MTDLPNLPVAIIGAGVAGLACARALQAEGLSTVVFDKGRGPGGRLSTRRIDSPQGPIRFDHGAQFFTARDPLFLEIVEHLTASGHVATLDPGTIGRRTVEGWQSGRHDEPLFVGSPGMNGVIHGLAGSLDVRWGVRVVGLEPAHGGALRLHVEDGALHGPFKAVVIAVPGEQVDELAGALAPALAHEAQAMESAPCWAFMAVADGVPPSLPYPAFESTDGGPLSWISREELRPERTGPARFVAHASPAWSREYLELDAAEVAAKLGAALSAITGARLLPGIAHRWRYAQVTTPATTPFFWDPDVRIGACGDWRIGPRIECAWQSGSQLGQAMASALGD